MPSRIEDYALVGDCQSSALVGRDGSIDWLCLPRFDSGACFAALLGRPEHGRWLIGPRGGARSSRRRYRADTLVLETDFEAAGGELRVIDFMPPRTDVPDLVRIVECLSGSVEVEMELMFRFDYGSITPWVQPSPRGIIAIAGPDRVELVTPAPLDRRDGATRSRFRVGAGERVPFVLTWTPSHRYAETIEDPEGALAFTERFWREWAGRARYAGPWRDAVVRSLITLKALTYEPTGGIVAAPTTSLPEKLGGVRNWDYRYCWLRDATITLDALVDAGYREEARAWREWLLRAVAGKPSELHTMYGIAGERRLTEIEIPWLPGYEGSHPVRTGNAAYVQLQLDVFGEVLDAMHECRVQRLEPGETTWQLERALVEHLASIWREPDEGVWEVRGARRHFTHSKVMAWVALDRAIKTIDEFHLGGPADRWRSLRAAIHEDVCRHGFDPTLGSFVQSYGSSLLDASLLVIPRVGFLPASDPRVRGTIAAIEQRLCDDGLVRRYEHVPEVDGLPHGEGVFLPCSFWLADALALAGRRDESRALFERLLALRNDVGLLAEEYSVGERRFLGNFPQAWSHVALVNTAFYLSGARASCATPR